MPKTPKKTKQEIEITPTVTKVKASGITKKPKARFDLSSIAILFLPLAFLLGIGGGYLLWGLSSGGSANNSGQNTFNPVGDDPALGPEDAPVTIVEFSDFQCPYCQVWYEQVFTQLMADYPDQIRFVYRDFPLIQIHPGAQPAAEAAECANDQDKYWDFHDAIFSGQYEFSRDGFLKIAADLGLNTTTFASCIDSGKYADEVLGDLQDGINMGVQSTPTFYINGFKVEGALPYESFKSIIDQILAGNQ
jgi:protein-disulfide isomerase